MHRWRRSGLVALCVLLLTAGLAAQPHSKVDGARHHGSIKHPAHASAAPSRPTPTTVRPEDGTSDQDEAVTEPSGKDPGHARGDRPWLVQVVSHLTTTDIIVGFAAFMSVLCGATGITFALLYRRPFARWAVGSVAALPSLGSSSPAGRESSARTEIAAPPPPASNQTEVLRPPPPRAPILGSPLPSAPPPAPVLGAPQPSAPPPAPILGDPLPSAPTPAPILGDPLPATRPRTYAQGESLPVAKPREPAAGTPPGSASPRGPVMGDASGPIPPGGVKPAPLGVRDPGDVLKAMVARKATPPPDKTPKPAAPPAPPPPTAES